MSNASNTDQVDTGESVGYKFRSFLTSVVGKLFAFVVFLVAFGRLLELVGTNTGLFEYSTMISLLVGMSYSLAAVIVLVGLIVGIVLTVR